jgi:hypothetical protein
MGKQYAHNTKHNEIKIENETSPHHTHLFASRSDRAFASVVAGTIPVRPKPSAMVARVQSVREENRQR